MQQRRRGKVSHVLLAINIIPMIFFGLAIMILCLHWFTRIMYAEVEQEMQNLAHSTNLLLETAYPGDYVLMGENSYQLYKGEHDITHDYALLDQIKAATDTEVTLFYQDTRILTTICDSKGARYIGTRAPNVAIREVLETGEAHFYDKAIINNSAYFSYYMPIKNADGTVAGMIFVGKPSRDVDASIQGSIYPLMLVLLLGMTITSILLYRYIKKLVDSMLHIRSFLVEVSTGNLNAELNPIVSTRNDEFGDIGRSAVAMQSALRTMVEQDTLTELFNRRSANRKLKQIINKHETQHTPFALAIGDIDFFKKVNDTYGHDAGDLILKNVANVLRENMRTYGFAARWGGEEFLLVFDKTEFEQARMALEQIMDAIRDLESIYDRQTIKITMTFGLVEGDDLEPKQLLRIADDRLYVGKTMGRNQIVWDD